MKNRILIVSAVLVVIVLVLGGYLYLAYPGAGQAVSAGTNATVDSYPAGASYAWVSPQGPVQGVEPTLAVAGDGTLYTAWIGLSASSPTTTANSSLVYRSQIMFASSTDGGKTYSSPVPVSNSTDPLTYNCFDPTIGASSNGSIVYVAYTCSTNMEGEATTVNLAVGRAGPSGAFVFTQKTISVGLSFDRPWLQVSSGGAVDLVWDSPYLVYWTTLAPNGTEIGPPSFNKFATSFGWVSGMGVLGNGTIVVSVYGYDRPAPVNSTISVLVASLTLSQSQGFLSWRNLYELSVPSALYMGGNETYLPGPAMALAPDGTVYLALVANEGHSILLTWRHPGNSSWAIPVTVEASLSAMVDMPELAVNPSGDTVAVAWMGNSTGHWDAYAAVFLPAGSKVLPVVRLSSAEGFASGLLAWHGDFMAAAFTSKGAFVVLWSDGRGVPDYYGYGHIYSSVVTVS